MNSIERWILILSFCLSLIWFAEMFEPCVRFWLEDCAEIDNKMNITKVVMLLSFWASYYLFVLKRSRLRG